MMNGVGAGTIKRDNVKDESALSKLTLNSDDGRCADGATKSGSTGVESSLRC